MPERVKKTKCGRGGCCEKEIERGVCRKRVKEDKMRGGGVAKKI